MKAAALLLLLTLTTSRVQAQDCEGAAALPAWLAATAPEGASVGHDYRAPIELAFATAAHASAAVISVRSLRNLAVPVYVATSGENVAVTPRHGLGASASYIVTVTQPEGAHEFYFTTATCDIEESRVDYFAKPSNPGQFLAAVASWSSAHETSATLPASESPAVCPERGVICLRERGYGLHAPLDVPSCLEIIGAGPGTTIRLRSNTWAEAPGFPSVIRNARHENGTCAAPNEGNARIGLRSLRVLGCGTADDADLCSPLYGGDHLQSGRGSHGVGLYHVSDATLVDITIQDAATDGVYLGNNRAGPSRRIVVTGSRVTRAWRHGITATALSVADIESNEITLTRRNGISTENNNHIACGGVIQPETGAIEYIRVVDNWIHHIGYWQTVPGIKSKGVKFQAVDGAVWATGNRAIRNRFHDINGNAPGYGIHVAYSGAGISDLDLKITDNVLRGARVYVGGGRSPEPPYPCHNDVTGIAVTGNSIEDGYLRFQYNGSQDPPCSAYGNTVSGNTFYMRESGLKGPYDLACELQAHTGDNATLAAFLAHSEYCPGPAECGLVSCDVAPMDADGDGVVLLDNCSSTTNIPQNDSDGDGIGNACDSCPDHPLGDIDGDGVCEPRCA